MSRTNGTQLGLGASFCPVDPPMRDFLLDATCLAALGTIADVVPLLGENRTLAMHGLRGLPGSKHPGLVALLESAGLAEAKLDAYHVGFVLAPRLNACGRMGHARLAVELLTDAAPRRCREIADYLGKQNTARQQVEREITGQAVEMVRAAGMDREERRAIVLASEQWHGGVIGIVASRLVERYHLPTVLIAIDNGEGKGSARSIPGFHLYEALRRCEGSLIRYGGHKYAAGLTILPENIEAFRKQMIQVSGEMLTDDDLVPKLFIDSEIELDQVTSEFVDTLEKFSPFGPMNMRPIFLTRNLEVVGQPYRVGKNHLKMRVRKGEAVLDVIGFGFGDLVRPLMMRSGTIDMAYVIEFNHWNGVVRIQLRIKDIRFDGGHILRGNAP